MKRILFFLMIIGICACSSSNSFLPNSVYNVKLGETYTESKLIETLNKDTFRSFRVYHKGDNFLPGHHDTFYRSEREDIIVYSGYKAYHLAEFRFQDCEWSSFRIETDTEGKLTDFSFGKGTTMSTTPVSSIKADYDALYARLHRFYGASEDTEEDGKIQNVWKDSSTCLKVEYWEFLDYKNEPSATLRCEATLVE